MRPKAPVRAALLEVKAIVDGPLATLAPLERHRSLPDRKRRQEKEFLRQDLGTRIWGPGSGDQERGDPAPVAQKTESSGRAVRRGP